MTAGPVTVTSTRPVPVVSVGAVTNTDCSPKITVSVSNLDSCSLQGYLQCGQSHISHTECMYVLQHL